MELINSTQEKERKSDRHRTEQIQQAQTVMVNSVCIYCTFARLRAYEANWQLLQVRPPPLC
jgi:hypothetical protein